MIIIHLEMIILYGLHNMVMSQHIEEPIIMMILVIEDSTLTILTIMSLFDMDSFQKMKQMILLTEVFNTIKILLLKKK